MYVHGIRRNTQQMAGAQAARAAPTEWQAGTSYIRKYLRTYVRTYVDSNVALVTSLMYRYTGSIHRESSIEGGSLTAVRLLSLPLSLYLSFRPAPSLSANLPSVFLSPSRLHRDLGDSMPAPDNSPFQIIDYFIRVTSRCQPPPLPLSLLRLHSFAFSFPSSLALADNSLGKPRERATDARACILYLLYNSILIQSGSKVILEMDLFRRRKNSILFFFFRGIFLLFKIVVRFYDSGRFLVYFVNKFLNYSNVRLFLLYIRKDV